MLFPQIEMSAYSPESNQANCKQQNLFSVPGLKDCRRTVLQLKYLICAGWQKQQLPLEVITLQTLLLVWIPGVMSLPLQKSISLTARWQEMTLFTAMIILLISVLWYYGIHSLFFDNTIYCPLGLVTAGCRCLHYTTVWIFHVQEEHT